MIDEMVRDDVIAPTSSRSRSPVVFVKKIPKTEYMHFVQGKDCGGSKLCSLDYVARQQLLKDSD